MTSNYGLPIIVFVLCGGWAAYNDKSVGGYGFLLMYILLIIWISKFLEQFGIFRWSCIFCGKPDSGSLIKMLITVCKHE